MEEADFAILESRDDSERTLQEMMREERMRMADLLRSKRGAERVGNWKYDTDSKIERLKLIVAKKKPDGISDYSAGQATTLTGKPVGPLPRAPEICGWKGYDPKGSLYWCNNGVLQHPRTHSALDFCGYHLAECVASHPSGVVLIPNPNEKALCHTHYVSEFGKQARLYENEFHYPGIVFVRAGTTRHPLAPKAVKKATDDEEARLDNAEREEAEAEAREEEALKAATAPTQAQLFFRKMKKALRLPSQIRAERDKAATCMQAQARALIARRVVQRMRREITLRDRHRAAIMLQNAFRGMANKRKMHRMHLDWHDAAVRIQHFFRETMWKRKLKRDQGLRKAAHAIQHWFRLQVARMRLRMLHIRQTARTGARKRDDSFELLRKMVRMYKFRRAIKRMRDKRKKEHRAARKIQNFWFALRGNNMRKEMLENRDRMISLAKAAARISKSMKAWVLIARARRERARTMRSVLLMQRVAKGFLGRLKVRRRRAHVEAVWAWLSPTLPRSAYAQALGFPDYDVMFADRLAQVRAQFEAVREEGRRRARLVAEQKAESDALAASRRKMKKGDFSDVLSPAKQVGAGKGNVKDDDAFSLMGEEEEAEVKRAHARSVVRAKAAATDGGEVTDEEDDPMDKLHSERGGNALAQVRARAEREREDEAYKARAAETLALHDAAVAREDARKAGIAAVAAAEEAKAKKFKDRQAALDKQNKKKAIPKGRGEAAAIPMNRAYLASRDPFIAAAMTLGLEDTLQELAKPDRRGKLVLPESETAGATGRGGESDDDGGSSPRSIPPPQDPAKARIAAFLTVLEESFKSQDAKCCGLLAPKPFERIMRAHGLQAPMALMRVITDTFTSRATGSVSYEAYLAFARRLDGPCPVHHVLVCPACMYTGPCDKCNCKKYMVDGGLAAGRDHTDVQPPTSGMNPHSTMCGCGHHKSRHAPAMIVHPKVTLPTVTNSISAITALRTSYATQAYFAANAASAASAMASVPGGVTDAKLTAELSKVGSGPGVGAGKPKLFGDFMFAPQPATLAPAMAAAHEMKALSGNGAKSSQNADGKVGGAAPGFADTQGGGGAALSEDMDTGVGSPAYRSSLRFTGGLGLTRAGLMGVADLDKSGSDWARGIGKVHGTALSATMAVATLPALGEEGQGQGEVMVLSAQMAAEGYRPPSMQGERAPNRPSTSSSRPGTGMLVPADILPSDRVYSAMEGMLRQFEDSGTLAGSGAQGRRLRQEEEERERGGRSSNPAMGRTLEELRSMNYALERVSAITTASVGQRVRGTVADSNRAIGRALAAASSRAKQAEIAARGCFEHPRGDLFGEMSPSLATRGSGLGSINSFGSHAGVLEDEDIMMVYDERGRMALEVPRATPPADRVRGAGGPFVTSIPWERKRRAEGGLPSPIMVPAMFIEALQTGTMAAEGAVPPTAGTTEAGLRRSLAAHVDLHRRGTVSRPVLVNAARGTVHTVDGEGEGEGRGRRSKRKTPGMGAPPWKASGSRSRSRSDSRSRSPSPSGRTKGRTLMAPPKDSSALKPANPARQMFTYLALLRALALPASDGYDLVADPARLQQLVLDHASFLRERWSDVVADVRTGKLAHGPSGVLSAEQRAALAQMFMPNPGRAAFIDNVFRSMGFHKAKGNLKARARSPDRHSQGRKGAPSPPVTGYASGSDGEDGQGELLAALLRSDMGASTGSGKGDGDKVKGGSSPYRSLPAGGSLADHASVSAALQARTRLEYRERAEERAAAKAEATRVRQPRNRDEAALMDLARSLGIGSGDGQSAVRVHGKSIGGMAAGVAAGGGAAAVRNLPGRGYVQGALSLHATGRGADWGQADMVAVPAPPPGAHFSHPAEPFSAPAVTAKHPYGGTMRKDENDHFEFFRVTGPRSFACRHPTCGKTFGTIGAAVRHTRDAHHGDLPLLTSSESDAYLSNTWKAAGMVPGRWTGVAPNPVDKKAQAAMRAAELDKAEAEAISARKAALVQAALHGQGTVAGTGGGSIVMSHPRTVVQRHPNPLAGGHQGATHISMPMYR